MGHPTKTVFVRLASGKQPGGGWDQTREPELRARLAAAVEAGATRIIVDLAGVEFVDAVILGVFIHARKLLRPRGRDVYLTGATGQPAQKLDYTGIGKLFAVPDSADEESGGPVGK